MRVWLQKCLYFTDIAHFALSVIRTDGTLAEMYYYFNEIFTQIRSTEIFTPTKVMKYLHHSLHAHVQYYGMIGIEHYTVH